jgi:hypothetical protein
VNNYPQYIVEIDKVPISYPYNTDLAVMMKLVDKLRQDYPKKEITIYEISKNIIDY